MLCVNQSERWSAKQLLEHTWIVTDDDELLAKDLTKSILAMRKFKARMRFKAAAKAIIATKRMMKGMAKTLQPTSKPASNLCQLPAIEMQQKMSRRLVNSTIDTSNHLPLMLPSIYAHTNGHNHANEHEHENTHTNTHTPRPEFSQNTGRKYQINLDEGEEAGRREEDMNRVDNKMHERICNDQINRMREKEKEREMEKEKEKEKERKKNSERIKEKIVDRKKEKVRGGDKERVKETEREGVKLQELVKGKKSIQLDDSLRITEQFIQCNRSPASISTTMSMSVPESVEGSAPGTPRSSVAPLLLTLPILSLPSEKIIPLFEKEKCYSAKMTENSPRMKSSGYIVPQAN